MHWKSTCNSLALVVSLILCLATTVFAQNSVSSGQPKTPVTFLDSTKDQDGLVGSVRRVKTESAKIEIRDGRLEEGPLQLIELTTYAVNGKRIENVSYPVASAPVGREEYRYDDKGNIVEMTLRANDGSIISRESYDYEFDHFGNWKKMVTSLVVFEGGQLKREPVEVTYRTLTYYFDDAVASIVDGSPRSTMPSVPAAINRSGVDYVAATPVSQVLSRSQPQFEVSGAPPELVRKKPALIKEPSVAETETTDESVAPTTTSKASDDVPAESIAEERLESAPIAMRKKGNAEEDAPVVPESNAVSPARSKAFVLYQAGSMNLESGDAKGAVAAYLESLKLEPDSALVNLSLGHAYLRLKKSGEAAKAFKRATTLNPDLAEAHYGLGFVYFEQHKFRDAVNAFKRATALQPTMAKAHFGLALGYQELEDERGLVEEYRILQRLDHALSKKLEQTFADSSLPCRTKPFCK